MINQAKAACPKTVFFLKEQSYVVGRICGSLIAKNISFLTSTSQDVHSVRMDLPVKTSNRLIIENHQVVNL